MEDYDAIQVGTSRSDVERRLGRGIDTGDGWLYTCRSGEAMHLEFDWNILTFDWNIVIGRSELGLRSRGDPPPSDPSR
jgi:hypothetical protein